MRLRGGRELRLHRAARQPGEIARLSRRVGAFEDTLKACIEEDLIRDKFSGPVVSDTSLMERGVLDSLGLMSLVAFIEETTGIRIAADEVMLENFETINAIGATVDRARRERGAGLV